MSADLFRKYVDIINENSKPEEKGPDPFLRSYHSGEGPRPPEPLEIIDDPEEIAELIHRAYNMPDSSDPEQNVQNADIRRMVKNALLQLKPGEERIIRMRYGIGVPEMTYKEIAEKFGLSMSRIKILESKILGLLRLPSRVLRKSEKKRLPPAPTYAAYDKDPEKYKKDDAAYRKAYYARPDHLE